MRILAAVLTLAAVLMLVACEEEGDSADDSEPTPTEDPSEDESAQAETLDSDVQEAAISLIMEETLVQDAAISQDGDTLSLVLIVNAATNEEHARTLGDNFVRLVKTLGPDEGPGRNIGEGNFTYIIGVYAPSEEEIAGGSKPASAASISW